MNHALHVRVLESFRDPSRDAQGFRPFEPLLRLEELLEGLPGKELERHEEGARGGVAAHIVDDDDARVGQPRGALGLGEETLFEAGPFGFVGAQGELDHLERYVPSEVGILREINDAHHPPAQLALELIPTDGFRTAVRHRFR